MDIYYIINSYLDEMFVSSSDIFHDKNEIDNLKSVLDKKTNTTNVIFECKPIDNNVNYTNNVNDANDSNDTNDANDSLKQPILYKYFKGYVLVPNKNDPYYEMTRLNNGDWCDDLKGWYYNKNEIDKLKERGYTINSKLIVDYHNYDINLLEIYFYDKGFILSPKKSYKYYGQKYLLEGKWIKEQKGWYFKNIKKYRKFINMGAIDMINDTFME
tara:strand:- start:79 stop:720 length:642 start_codon:yes stop_codon:yes gene_type:complete